MKYESIKDGEQATIVFPNINAMITGIATISQNNKGEISVHGFNGDDYYLGIVNDTDIMTEHENELENALAAKLMPLCTNEATQ